MRLDSSGRDCSTQVNRDLTSRLCRWTWVDDEWHVGVGGGGGGTMHRECWNCRLGLSTSRTERKSRSLPLSHGGWGGREEAPPQSGWCMVWTLACDLGFNGGERQKMKGGGGSCLNYADAGRNRGEKTQPRARLLPRNWQSQKTRLLSLRSQDRWHFGKRFTWDCSFRRIGQRCLVNWQNQNQNCIFKLFLSTQNLKYLEFTYRCRFFAQINRPKIPDWHFI